MTDRTRQGRRALAGAALALPLLFAGPAAAAPVGVTLRVEGKDQTIYEAQITTDGHDVTTASGGTNRCDGTNNGAQPTPGPTATAALDDAARLGGFTWDGDFYTQQQGFDDYAITRVGPDSQTSSEFWEYRVDYQDPGVGGCQVRLEQGDEVLWGYDLFGKPLLKLTAPGSARTGEPFAVTVTDGQDGSVEPGASVNGAATGADGNATLQFDEKGIYRLKATRPDAIRSNAAVVCVDPPGAEPCTSTDQVAPTLRVTVPGELASEGSRSRTILVSWQGDDRMDGSGVRTYGVDVREVASGAVASQDGWTTLREGIPNTAVHFRGESGGAYQFRVRALDRANNRGELTTNTVVIPIDDRDRRLVRASRGWRRVARSGAWGRFVLRSSRRGARARVRFRGSRVAVIGRKLPRGGRLRVSVDGRSKVIRVRGRSAHRRVLYTSARRPAGRHTLRLTALGGGPVEVDAVAPLP